MSEAREASWYEIALTHSQIVKIFVALLVCLVGAFFSGVWIGRDAVNAVENVAVASPSPGAGEAVAEGEEVAQLNFFTDDEVVPTGTAALTETRNEPEPAVQSGGAGTTLVDDLSADSTEPAAAPATPPAAEPAPTQIADNTPDAPVQVVKEESTAPAQNSGELVVQVFSSNDATQARRVLGRLAQGGHPAFLSPVEVSGRTMYRVRIGPYIEREQAESVAESVRRTFKLDTWITQKST